MLKNSFIFFQSSPLISHSLSAFPRFLIFTYHSISINLFLLFHSLLLSLFFFFLFFLLNFPPFFHPAVHRRVPSSELRFRYFINCLFSFRCLRTFVLSHLQIFFFSSSSILSAISPNIFTFTVAHISFCHSILHIIYVTSSRPLFISPFLSFPVFLFFFFFANASPPPFCVIVYTSLFLYFPSSVPFLREIYNVPSQSNFSSSQRRNNLDANSRPGTPSSESHLRESDPWRELRSRKSNDDARLRALLCCSIRKPVLPSPNLPLILTFADFHSNYVIRML